MSGNSGAWGLALWMDGKDNTFGPSQEQGISLEGGDPVVPYLPTVPLGSLLLPPDGMGLPGIRSGDVVFAQRDGVVQFADYYNPRILTFQVSIKNDGCPGCPDARQKVSRLIQEWSRNCDGATLVLFTDCHNPSATEAEKVYLGPYLVHGRPRVAEVTWRRSNIGGALVTLRFDCEDAGLLLALTPDGSNWGSQHTLTPDENENLLSPTQYRLTGRTMTLNGATVIDQFFTAGAPDGGSYFTRFFSVANTSSPMTMDVTDSGLLAVPATPAATYTLSWWAQKSVVGGPQTRTNMAWYNAAGALISTTTGTNMSAATAWGRHSQVFVAPALTAFMKPIMAWSGTALVGQSLDLAQVWLNTGGVATAPDTMEVVGTLCVYPTIELLPTLTAPIVVSIGPNTFTYSANVTDQVTIDTRYGRASSLGVDVTQNLSGEYDQPLPPGVHDVVVDTANNADSGQVTVVWSNAVVSG